MNNIYTKEQIIKTLNRLDFPLDKFFKVLEEERMLEDEIKRLQKQEEEKIKYIEDDFDFDGLPFDTTPEKLIKSTLRDVKHDMFYEYDGLPDEGVDRTIYVKIGDKIYEVKLHCEAEWVGDWSVRKNLPGDVSIISITEIEYKDLKGSKFTKI